MISDRIISKSDGLALALAISVPNGKPRAIVQFSHGMAEHKERYFAFMRFLSSHGFLCIIHDHRGHGESVSGKNDLGYFYTENPQYIVDDLYQVTQYAKARYGNLPVYIFSHSMGTLVVRNYLKTYDTAVEKVVLCGPPVKNSQAGLGVAIAKTMKLFGGGKRRSKLINKIAEGRYSKEHDIANGWINSDRAEVEKYNQDELCGYIFTVNGYVNLLKLLRNAYRRHGWHVRNKKLAIYIVAGREDPVIESEEKIEHLVHFLHSVGYKNIFVRLYGGMRHELLNETNKQAVYKDILDFFAK